MCVYWTGRQGRREGEHAPVVGAQTSAPSSAVFPAKLAGIWIVSGAVRIPMMLT